MSHDCMLSKPSSLTACVALFFFFKQKTAYEMRISDWSSDVCSSDLFASRPMPDSSRHREYGYIGIHSRRELESGSAGNRADTGTGLRASSGAKPSAKNADRRVAGLISLTGGQDGQASHVSWFVGKAGGAAGNANQWTVIGRANVCT